MPSAIRAHNVDMFAKINSDYRLTSGNASTRLQRSARWLLALFGWRVRFAPLPGPRGVVIVYPHTSNWDFILGLLAKWAIGLQVHWLGKEALFRGLCGALLGPLLRACGGQPIERGTSTGATERLTRQIHAADWYWLALAPEGTRNYRNHWRSGFYHIALAAQMPLAMAYIDYARKEIGLVDHLRLSGDIEADMAAIREVYKDRRGLKHRLAAPIVLRPADPEHECRK
jgi:1-acyl-sn-glycerol-3-phosphate acyltransferase